LWNRMDIYIQPKLKWHVKCFVFIDFIISIPLYGLGINDYLQYEFYKKRYFDRRDFLVHRKRMKIVKTFNIEKDRELFDNKEKFNEIFSDYLGRVWLYTKSSDYDTFVNFAKSVGKFIVKPTKGSHGKGIRIVEFDNIQNLEEMYEELLQEDSLLEEFIIQHENLASFNKTSVNSLRVVTLLCPDGIVRVMTANLRMGNGVRYADNFHHNGIASLLDTDTGVVISTGIDRDFRRYVYHPYSNKQIVGFQVPFWDKVVDTVTNAAMLMPTVGYIGWDVAIGHDGRIIIIEGNAAADPDVSQMPDQI